MPDRDNPDSFFAVPCPVCKGGDKCDNCENCNCTGEVSPEDAKAYHKDNIEWEPE